MAKNISTIRGEVEGQIKTVQDRIESLTQERARLSVLRDCLDATPEFVAQQQRVAREALAQATEGRIVRPRRKAGRPVGSGKRREEVIALLKKYKGSGLTPVELGAMIGVKPNYLYRILNALQAEKIAVKTGKKWKAV